MVLGEVFASGEFTDPELVDRLSESIRQSRVPEELFRASVNTMRMFDIDPRGYWHNDYAGSIDTAYKLFEDDFLQESMLCWYAVHYGLTMSAGKVGQTIDRSLVLNQKDYNQASNERDSVYVAVATKYNCRPDQIPRMYIDGVFRNQLEELVLQRKYRLLNECMIRRDQTLEKRKLNQSALVDNARILLEQEWCAKCGLSYQGVKPGVRPDKHLQFLATTREYVENYFLEPRHVGRIQLIAQADRS